MNYLVIALWGLIIVPLYADFFNSKKQDQARSFLYTRPFYDYLFLERLFNRAVNYKKGKLQAGLSLIGAHQQSTHNQKTTHYFLARDRDALSIAGDDTIQKNSRDFRAEWIGLPNDFFAVFTFKPKQKQDGVSIEWIQQLAKWTENSFLSDCYIRILLPFYSARNHLDFESSGDTKQELLQAFNNSAWLFAHITDQHQHRTGLGKVELAFGSKYEEERLTLMYETMVAIPTGNKQNAKKLFQPVVGSNRHFEIGGRLCIDYGLCTFENPLQVHFFVDLQGILLVKNHQNRTIDLKQKPLSRYLLFNKQSTEPSDINIPGVNVLTRRCSVRPFMIADFSVGWSFFYKNFCFEFGYNVWGRHQERVELSDPFVPEFGIAGTEPGTTASLSTIAKQAPNDELFTPITFFDLDFRSAQSASAVNQTIHFALGRCHIRDLSEMFFSASFFREFAQQHGALSKWGIALKLTKTL